jgi:lysozyme family protein
MQKSIWRKTKMADFSIAVSITVDPAHEGGFQDNPNDSGNWTGGKIGVGELKGTNFGISAAEFPDIDIVNLTVSQAKSLYQAKYWNPLYSQIKDQFIANKIFDLGVLFGVSTAVEYLQKVLVAQFGLKVDGAFGPVTLAAINGSEPISLLTAYKVALVARAIGVGRDNPADRPFVGDWIRRINS